MDEEKSDRDNCCYQLRDLNTNHIWLTFGTDNSDDYYPIDKFIEEFRGEDLYHIYLFIWLSFNLTW